MNAYYFIQEKGIFDPVKYLNMNDEILVQFVCLHVHGGVVDLLGRGEFDQNIPHGGSIKIFYFSFGNEPL